MFLSFKLYTVHTVTVTDNRVSIISIMMTPGKRTLGETLLQKVYTIYSLIIKISQISQVGTESVVLVFPAKLLC